jgi:glycosyltransferase involved in cell wall biosynthesis
VQVGPPLCFYQAPACPRPVAVRACASREPDIGEPARLALPNANWLGTIYHGLPENSFQPSFAKGGYLAFLGRLVPEKGPEAAIRIALASAQPLRIAAKVPQGERRFFKQRLEPMMDGENIRLIGEVDDRTKQDFLAGAAALLFPIDWPEPFGLIMIESMACGTPVIAFPSGSVPEVIEDGVNGFIVESEDEAVRAVKRISSLDRREVRRSFERRFTAAEWPKIMCVSTNNCSTSL